MILAADLSSIISNLTGLSALIVVLIAGLVAVTFMAKHRLIGIILTIAAAAIVYLAIKGTLVQDVATWFQQLGL